MNGSIPPAPSMALPVAVGLAALPLLGCSLLLVPEECPEDRSCAAGEVCRQGVCVPGDEEPPVAVLSGLLEVEQEGRDGTRVPDVAVEGAGRSLWPVPEGGRVAVEGGTGERTYPLGETLVPVVAFDGNGRVVGRGSVSVRVVDRTPPEVDLHPEDPGGGRATWFREEVTVRVVVRDACDASPDFLEVEAGADLEGEEDAGERRVVFGREGVFRCRVEVGDASGNRRVAILDHEFGVDLQAPDLEVGLEATRGPRATEERPFPFAPCEILPLSLVARDAGSGVEAVEVRAGDGDADPAIPVLRFAYDPVPGTGIGRGPREVREDTELDLATVPGPACPTDGGTGFGLLVEARDLAGRTTRFRRLLVRLLPADVVPSPGDLPPEGTGQASAMEAALAAAPPDPGEAAVHARAAFSIARRAGVAGESLESLGAGVLLAAGLARAEVLREWTRASGEFLDPARRALEEAATAVRAARRAREEAAARDAAGAETEVVRATVSVETALARLEVGLVCSAGPEAIPDLLAGASRVARERLAVEDGTAAGDGTLALAEADLHAAAAALTFPIPAAAWLDGLARLAAACEAMPAAGSGTHAWADLTAVAACGLLVEGRALLGEAPAGGPSRELAGALSALESALREADFLAAGTLCRRVVCPAVTSHGTVPGASAQPPDSYGCP